jgi:hypothetical protein
MSTFNTNDFIVGLDPTGLLNITGAQLAQLVNSAAPQTDRGLVIVSTDALGVPNVPNPNTGNAEWVRYIWLRILATSVIPYVWNPAAATDTTDTALLNWVTIQQSSFAPNSIPGTALINNSVPASAIVSLAYAQLTGAPSAASTSNTNALTSDGYITSNLFSNANFVWGCLQGSGNTPGTPILAAGSVSSASIPAQAVAGNQTALTGQIKDNTVTSVQLLNNGGVTIGGGNFQSLAAVDPGYNMSISTKSIAGLPSVSNYRLSSDGVNGSLGDVLAVNYNGASNQAGWVRCTRAILSLADPTVASAAAGKIIQVNAGSTGYQLAALQPILQETLVVNKTVYPNSGNLANSTSTPYYNDTGMTPSFNSGAIVKVDTTGTSKFYVRVKVSLCLNGQAFVGLYNATGATAPVAGVCAYCSNIMQTLSFDYVTAANPANCTYYIAFGVLSGGFGAYMNSVNGTTNPFLITQSSIEVTEIL